MNVRKTDVLASIPHGPRPGQRTVAGVVALLAAIPLPRASGALALAAWGALACDKTQAGVQIDLEVDDEQYRPQYVMFHWLRPGRLPFEERLPENGLFSDPGRVIGSLFIETVGPLQEPRGLAVRGFRDGNVVSGSYLRIEAGGESQRHLVAVLGAPLADADGNGVPDVVDHNCLDDPGGAACDARAPDGGPSVHPDPEVDAAAPGHPDAPHDLAAPPPEASTGMPIEEGLVGLWHFDDREGSRIATDSSGNKNDGMLRGAASFIPGAKGGALDVPSQQGNGAMVPASPSIDAIHAAFSIAGWIFRTTERSGLANLMSRRSTGTAEHFALAIDPDGNPKVYINSHATPSGLPLTGPDAVPLDQWVHLAATYDSHFVRLYVGGIEVANAPCTVPIAAERTALCLGCGQNNDSSITEPLAGHLDELRLYSRALNPVEVAALAR